MLQASCKEAGSHPSRQHARMHILFKPDLISAVEVHVLEVYLVQIWVLQESQSQI